jgi:hypothetical protein
VGATEMAIEMILEFEGAIPDWDVIQKALDSVGKALTLRDAEGKLKYAYSEGADYWISPSYKDSIRGNVNAEGGHGCKFVHRGELTFRARGGFKVEAVAEIKYFLESLCKLSPIQFVLSHQYEDVYAFRDYKRGFVWCWDNPLMSPGMERYIAAQKNNAT